MKVSAIIAVALLAADTSAGGLDDDVIGGRAIGRAGTGTVSDDGAGALIGSPAALARRGDRRVQLGAALIDDDLEFVPDDPDAPAADDQSAARLAPAFAVAAGAGPIVFGLAVIVDGSGRELDAPRPGLQPATVERTHPHRYAGIAAHVRRRTVAAGCAARVTDWLAVGATATLADVRITERRRIWAGFAGREDLASAQRDVEIAVEGDDNLVPGAAFGAFVAPASLPIEAAISIAWTNAVHVDGSATIRAADPSEVEIVPTGDPGARLDLAMPIVVRAGARYLGERYSIEAGVDAWRVRDADAVTWEIYNTSVGDVQTMVVRPLDGMASRIRPRSRVAARAAADVELLAGFLWLTGGYAWRDAGQDDADLAPSTADLGGHTAALGVEVSTSGITATVGWSRTFASRRSFAGGTAGLDNPFDAGDQPTGRGRYDTGRDLVGIAIEIAAE